MMNKIDVCYFGALFFLTLWTIISLDVIITENVAIVYYLCKYGKRAIQYPIKIFNIYFVNNNSPIVDKSPLFSVLYCDNPFLRKWGLKNRLH